MTNERQYWIEHKNKIITISTPVNNKDYIYTGELIDILEEKIVIKDRLIGNLFFKFSEVKLIGVRE